MAVLKVNGETIPSPTEMKITLVEVGSGDVRSASGALVRDVLAVKRRLTLRWAHVAQAELSELLGAVSGTAFQAEYPDPVTRSTRTAMFRAGDVSAGVLRMADGIPIWTDVSMEWIER